MAKAWYAVLCMVLWSGAPAAAQSPAEAQAELIQAYSRAMQRSIRDRWTLPEGREPRGTCPLVVRQLPGGGVLHVEPHPACEYDEATREALVEAVWEASPLPYRGYEAVFAREIKIVVRMDQD